MPFKLTPVMESGGHQLFSVGIDDVDREKDRLVVTFSSGAADEVFAFALANDETGKDLLLLDRDNSNATAIKSTHDNLREGLGQEHPEEVALYLVADRLPDTVELMLTLPPIIEIFVSGNSCTNEFELEDGETVTVESRTLG